MVRKEEELALLIKELKKKFDSFMFNSIPDIKDNNFSINDYKIFEFIGKSKKTMSEIAEEIKLTPGTVTTIVDDLINKKYLKRERDEKLDRRKVFVSLSLKGNKLYNTAFEKKVEFSNKLLKKLNKSEQDNLFKLFNKIKEIDFK